MLPPQAVLMFLHCPASDRRGSAEQQANDNTFTPVATFGGRFVFGLNPQTRQPARSLQVGALGRHDRHTIFIRPDDNLNAALQVKLGQNITDVRLDRSEGNKRFSGNVIVTHSLGHELYHFDLAISKHTYCWRDDC
jgi:hypothetical protein